MSSFGHYGEEGVSADDIKLIMAGLEGKREGPAIPREELIEGFLEDFEDFKVSIGGMVGGVELLLARITELEVAVADLVADKVIMDERYKFLVSNGGSLQINHDAMKGQFLLTLPAFGSGQGTTFNEALDALRGLVEYRCTRYADDSGEELELVEDPGENAGS